jgi:hypothetical protein
LPALVFSVFLQTVFRHCFRTGAFEKKFGKDSEKVSLGFGQQLRPLFSFRLTANQREELGFRI